MINNYVNDFEKYLLIDKKYSIETVKSYLSEINKYIVYLNKNNLKFNNIDNCDILDYIKYLKNNKMTITSLNHNISVLRNFYKYLYSFKYISKNPMEYIELSKVGKKLPQVLSYEEIKTLLDINLIDKYDYRNKAMLEVMYATGLRVSELVNLKINDIDFNDCIVRTLGKGKKERIIPIGDYALTFVQIYLEQYRSQLLKKEFTDYLFLNHLGKKISRQAFYMIICDLAQQKGIKTHFSPHTLRHSFATHLIDRGADIVSIKEMLGHSSLSTTQIYTHISDQKRLEEYRKFHPHGNG